MTEITDTTASFDKKGILFYDDACSLCIRTVERLRPLLGSRRIALEPLPVGDAKTEMRLQMADGTYGGADAAVRLGREFWWARPMVWLSSLPGMMTVLRAFYRQVAARRNCRNGECRISSDRSPSPLLYTPALLLLASGTASPLPGWARMWLLAAGIFYALKVALLPRGLRLFSRRVLGWFFLWPGLGAREFFFQRKIDTPTRAEFRRAVAFTAAGLTLIWLIAPRVGDRFITTWLSMVGLVLTFHFGTFHLISLSWRRAGVAAKPLMNRPLTSSSVREFWSRRWNTAFADAFRPITRRVAASTGWSVSLAAAMVFLVSGLLHEVVVSFPAGAGYGLPTLYFLIQAAGVTIERIVRFRAWQAHLWTLLIVALPLPLLFHPPFVERVAAPFFETLRAL